MPDLSRVVGRTVATEGPPGHQELKAIKATKKRPVQDDALPIRSSKQFSS